MDSQVACALIAKVAELYTNPETYLSFPLAPIAYSPAQLDSLRSQAVTAEALNQQAEFARIVNLVPGGPLWPPTSPSELWNLYDQILANMELATSLRTDDEEIRYRDALAVLYILQPDGIRTPTPELTRYQQFRDLWFVASEQYRNAVLDGGAEGSGDANTEVDRLKAELARVEAAWRNEGSREKVEAALRDEQTLGARSSVAQWEQWRTAMDTPGALPSDASGTRYGPTRIEPANVTSAPGWLQFTLNHDQVEAFARAAPPEIRSKLAPDQADVEIERLQFECTSVALQRPWFEEAALTSRIYRLPPAQPPVSDGLIPGSGACPAYVRGLVLARNFTVTLRENSPRNTAVLGHLAAGRMQMIAGFRLSAPAASKRVLLARIVPEEAATARARFVRTAIVTPPPSPTPVRIPAVARSVRVSAPAPAATPSRIVAMKNFTPFTRPGAVVTRPLKPIGRVMIPMNPPKPPPVTTTSGDEIHILGLICRSIAAAPNPDPTLQWS